MAFILICLVLGFVVWWKVSGRTTALTGRLNLHQARQRKMLEAAAYQESSHPEFVAGLRELDAEIASARQFIQQKNTKEAYRRINEVGAALESIGSTHAAHVLGVASPPRRVASARPSSVQPAPHHHHRHHAHHGGHGVHASGGSWTSSGGTSSSSYGSTDSSSGSDSGSSWGGDAGSSDSSSDSSTWGGGAGSSDSDSSGSDASSSW